MTGRTSIKILALVALPVALLLGALAARWRGNEGPHPTTAMSRAVETRKLTETEWVVARLERDDYLKDPGIAAAQMTLKPLPGASPDDVDGLEVLKIAEGSPMHQIGLRKSDRIVSVNGRPVASMERATRLTREIQESPILTFQVRRGDSLIDYRVRFE